MLDNLGDLPIPVSESHITGSFVIAPEAWTKNPTDIDFVVLTTLSASEVFEKFEEASRGGDYYSTESDLEKLLQYGADQICFRKGVWNIIVCTSPERYRSWVLGLRTFNELANKGLVDRENREHRHRVFEAVRSANEGAA